MISTDRTLLYAKEKTQLNVYDAVGRRVLTRDLGKTYQGEELIDTRKMPNGIYLYQVLQNGKKVSDGKFVVTH